MGRSLPQHEGRTPTYSLTPVFRQDYRVLGKKPAEWCTPVTLALGRWRQEDQEFKANLVYVAGFKGSLDYMMPCLQIKFQGENYVSMPEP